jgi:hypothetical protein
MENHGRNYIDRGELLICIPQLSANPTNSHLVAKQEKLAKEIMTFDLRSIFSHSSKCFLTCRKILQHGVDGFTSSPKECVLRIFIALAQV